MARAEGRPNYNSADPIDPNTVRTLLRNHYCGWCRGMEIDPEAEHKCKTDIMWYDKHWVCSCKCADKRWEELNSAEDLTKDK